MKRQYRALQGAIDERMQRVLEHGRFILGPEVEEVEGLLAAYAGSRYALTCASGTDALLLALMALGIAPGDEVITPAFSFVASAEVVALLRAVPVFVDIDPRTYNLDPAALEPAITSRTKAVVAVSLYGQCADMDAVGRIAARHGLAVIEDAAQSFGATYKGRHSCHLSALGCTSFFPSKPLGCYGDGGACFTDDPRLFARLQQVRNHGQEGRYRHTVLGINGRFDTLQAAVLLAKLEVFPAEVAARQAAAARYDQLLGGAVLTPYIEPHNASVYAQYTIEVEDRNTVQEALQTRGIPTAVHYPEPLHRQPVFASLGYREGSLPHSEAAARRVLSLPMHAYLTAAEQEEIARAVTAATRAANRVSE